MAFYGIGLLFWGIQIMFDLPEFIFYNWVYFFYRGNNVLDKKTELQKVMEKRSSKAKDKERQSKEQTEKTPFQKMLEERAKRLEQVTCHSYNYLVVAIELSSIEMIKLYC